MKFRKTIQLFFLTVVNLVILQAAQAQEGSSITVNAGGGSYKSEQVLLDWSIGELSRIDTRVSENKVLLVTQGILQPDHGRQLIMVTDPGFAPGEVRILPNPVKTHLQVQFSLRQAGRIRCLLYGTRGEQVLRSEFHYYGYGYTQGINMTHLPAGTYYLNVELEPVAGSARKGSFKIIKL